MCCCILSQTQIDLFVFNSIKPGKIVIVLAGRFAGRKAVIVKTQDEGTKENPFPHAIIAGIDRAPLKVRTSTKQQAASIISSQ
jgi:ribosomal protein L14E/L6E/L27E